MRVEASAKKIKMYAKADEEEMKMHEAADGFGLADYVDGVSSLEERLARLFF